jgi:hypothetical protein
MIYNEVGSGGTMANGFAFQDALNLTRTKFVPGEAVYYVAKARRGILERMIVKNVRTVTNRRTRGGNRVLYVDLYNRLWNERDLVLPEQAQALAAAYVERLLDDANELLAKC